MTVFIVILWILMVAASLFLVARHDGVICLTSLIMCIVLTPIVFVAMLAYEGCDVVLWERKTHILDQSQFNGVDRPAMEVSNSGLVTVADVEQEQAPRRSKRDYGPPEGNEEPIGGRGPLRGQPLL